MTKRRRGLYTQGEIHRQIDAFLHPAARRNPWWWVADTLLHGIVEQDPKVTLGKFLYYTLPELLEEAATRQKKLERRAQYGH